MIELSIIIVLIYPELSQSRHVSTVASATAIKVLFGTPMEEITRRDGRKWRRWICKDDREIKAWYTIYFYSWNAQTTTNDDLSKVKMKNFWENTFCHPLFTLFTNHTVDAYAFYDCFLSLDKYSRRAIISIILKTNTICIKKNSDICLHILNLLA